MTHLSDSELADVCRKANFNRSDLPTAIACALAASDGNAHYDHAIFPGPTACYAGLFGVDTVECPELIGEDLHNPFVAARIAQAMTEAAGGFDWCPSYRSGAFRQYVDRATYCASFMARPDVASPPVTLYGHRDDLHPSVQRYAAVADAIRHHATGRR